MHKDLLYKTFMWIWTLVIFIGCSLPGRDLPSVGLFDHFDKVVHFTFFIVFYLGWSKFFTQSNKNLFYLLMISVGYGFSLEFYQKYFVEGRSFDVWDGVADGLGACGGLLWVHFGNSKEEARD